MSAALSFHCMICFDQFDTETKYPVVLPCGHTYICVECASRIDKCMECRLSLYAPDSTINQNNNNENAVTSRWDIYEQRRRSRAYTSYSSPRAMVNTKKVAQKTRLPLPKNVVLLSLIEASDLATQTSRQVGISSSSTNHGLVAPTLSSDDEEEMEQNKILMSMDLATSSCGTYAVAKKSGLTILPMMDESGNRTSRKLFGDKNVLDDSLMTRKKSDFKKKEQQMREMHLNYGDRVQVVTIVNNWAKLARGYGYVRIENNNDLIKVAGVIDKACNIESMLYILSFRRSHLIDQKESIEKDAIQLMHELQETIIEHEDLTVIGAEAFASSKIIPQKDQRDDKMLVDSNSIETPRIDSNSGDENVMMSERPTTAQSTAASTVVTTGASSDSHQSNSFATWFSGFFRDTENFLYSDDEQHYQNMLASAESWRRRNGRQAERGVVDFRTGRSGHLGALGHHAQNHGSHGVGTFKISTHSGLTPNRRLMKKNSHIVY